MGNYIRKHVQDYKYFSQGHVGGAKDSLPLIKLALLFFRKKADFSLFAKNFLSPTGTKPKGAPPTLWHKSTRAYGQWLFFNFQNPLFAQGLLDSNKAVGICFLKKRF